MTFIQRHLLPKIETYIPSFSSKSSVNSASYKYADSFVTNPLSRNLETQESIELNAKSNPRIRQILAENHLPLKVNIKELEHLRKEHLYNTRICTAKIYSALPERLKEQVKLQDIQKAGILHDYGKVLIPDKILNKNEALTDKERNIIELHSELGYELLKSDKSINDNTLKLIKYHHQNPNKTGYPQAAEDFEYDISYEILKAADEYCALTENRAYKSAISREEALKIIYEDVKKGYISQEVFDALKVSTK